MRIPQAVHAPIGMAKTGLPSGTPQGLSSHHLATAIAAVAGATLLGASAAFGYAAPLTAVVAVGLGMWVARRHLSYLLPAILLILALNGIPGLDIKSYAVRNSFRPEDVFVIGLIALALYRMLLSPRRPLAPLHRYLWIWAPIFLAVWIVAWVRGMDAGASWLKAALFGRDFLYLALLAPLAGYLFADRTVSRRFCLFLGAWAGMFSVLLILAHVGLIGPSVVNSYLTREDGSIIRLYTPMISLVILTFSLSFGYALLGSRRHQWFAISLAVLTGVACLLHLTRAIYIGVAIGIVVSLILWAVRGSPRGRHMRRRLMVAAVTAGLILSVGILVIPSSFESGVVKTVRSRVSSGITALSNSSARAESTLGTREQVGRNMANYLDGRWLFGVGFVPPSARYVPDLPNGSIRNGDFGAINGVMTMGFVGTTLLYGPLLLMLGMWVIGGGRQSAAAAVAFGLVLWGTAVLASSPTSGPLFTISGVALVALVLGYAGYAMSPRPGS